MSFLARIADIELTVLHDPEPIFGSSAGSEKRSVSLRAYLAGSDKDNTAAQLSRLNSRLAAPCDFVMLSTDSGYPQMLHLTGGGVASITDGDRYEISGKAIVQITAPCDLYATPANRVYLDSPFGSDWPDETECERDDAQYVYADSSRYRVDAVSGISGTLTLYGKAIAGELLVIENQYRVTAISSATFTGELTWLDSSGNPIGTETKTLASSAAVGSDALVKAVFRVPDTAVEFSITYTFADSPDGDCTAFVWGVTAGVQLPATPMTAPWSLTSRGAVWSDDEWPEHEFERYPASDGGGAVWTYASGALTLTATALSEDSYVRALTIVPVVPGGRYGYSAAYDVDSYTDGTVRLRVWWYDELGVGVSFTDVETFTANTSAVVHYEEVLAPDGAHYAQGGMVVDAASDLAVAISDISFGQHIVETPAHMDLSQIEGEHAPDIEVWGDVDVEADAHLVTYAVGAQTPAAYIFEAEALTWTGGTTADTSSTIDYPGTGTTGKKNTGLTAASAPIDVKHVDPGTYELWVRARSSESDEATLGCDESGVTATTDLTTPSWMSLGQVHLPPKRAMPGTATTITVTAVGSDAAAVVQVDRYLLVPLTQGGAVTFHHGTAESGIDSLDVLEDGAVLVDEIVDMAYIVAAPLSATADDRLIVNSEKVARPSIHPDETTHLVTVVPLHTPLFDMWRGD